METLVPSADAAAITAEPLQIDTLVALVDAQPCGAVATFLGLVRGENAGRHVTYLEYEAYEPLALRALRRILAEAGDHWPGTRVACHHRIGRLEIGEASIAIAAAAPHRSEAFAACRYVIERVKQIAPIWKREHFDGGEVWIEGATADPEDETARHTALARARGHV